MQTKHSISLIELISFRAQTFMLHIMEKSTLLLLLWKDFGE